MNVAAQGTHGGDYLRQLREQSGMSIADVAARAGVDARWLAQIERTGTQSLGYDEIVTLVRASQPERPEWWDEGHEHDLTLGPDGYAAPRTEQQRHYWRRIEAVRSAIRDHYRHGRPSST